jgi:hypothetical protein
VNFLSTQGRLKHEFFVRAGGGIVNTDLEVCYQDNGAACAEPVTIDGANFWYVDGGLGHRFFLVKWAAIRTDIRYRTVLELIDGVNTPRGAVDLRLGAAFVF